VADSIDYLDKAHWDHVTAHDSLFLSRRYLRVLEQAGPDNLRQCYALIFRDSEPVAAIAAQSVSVSVSRLRKKSSSNGRLDRLDRLEEKMLVCGNLLSWGMHGISFAPNVDHQELWPAVAEAVYRLRRVDKLFGDTAFVMVKDIPDAYASAATTLSRFSYRELETEPNMVLDISPQWKSYDDYLASLTSKYRKQSKQIDKEVAAAGCVVEEIKTDEIARDAELLHALYLQTHKNARLRLVTLPVSFLPTLARELGDDMRFTVLSLGRTALEPKARLGARPDPMRVWIRHRIPMLNVIVHGLLHALDDHDEAPERNPFK